MLDFALLLKGQERRGQQIPSGPFFGSAGRALLIPAGAAFAELPDDSAGDEPNERPESEPGEKL
jgi:hypothetical protein